MTIQEAIRFSKKLIEEEKMLKEQKSILQSDKFADTVPAVKTAIEQIDDYVAKIPEAVKQAVESSLTPPPPQPKPAHCCCSQQPCLFLVLTLGGF